MEDKKQDAFYRKILRDSAMEQAPEGFTGSVMDRIRAAKDVTRPAPLIGRRAWLGIAVAAIVLVVLGMRIPTGESAGLAFLDSLADRAAALRLPAIDFPEVPVTYVYGAVFLLVFACCQLAWMKRYLENRLSA